MLVGSKKRWTDVPPSCVGRNIGMLEISHFISYIIVQIVTSCGGRTILPIFTLDLAQMQILRIAMFEQNRMILCLYMRNIIFFENVELLWGMLRKEVEGYCPILTLMRHGLATWNANMM